VSARPGGWS